MAIPAPTITQNNNRTYTASWNAVSASNDSGSVQYRLWSVTDGLALSSYSTSTSATLNIGTYDYAFQFKVQATYSGLTTNSGTTTKTFYKPSLNAPTNFKINGSTSYTGATAPLTWSAATFSGGQTPTYSIRIDGTQLTTTTDTSYTIPESTTKSYTSAVTITVVATGGGATSNATNEITYTYSPTLIGPSNLKINEATLYIGQSATLTWSKASLSNGGSIIYSIRKDGVEFDTTTDITYTITEDIAKTWGTSAISLTIVAIGGGKTSSASNAVTFTYKPAYKTIKYYNGTSWVKCIVYYHNGTKWIQTDIYCHNGSIWNPIDT